MQSKNTTYLLILVLVFVCSLISYRAFFEKGDEIKVGPVSFNQDALIENDLTADTFHLLLDYYDPFKQTYTSPKKQYVKHAVASVSPNKGVSVKVKPNILNNQKVSAKHIKYFGVIKNQNQSNIVGVVYIDNMELIVYEGFKSDGIEVVKMTEDQLELIYKEKMFTLKLENTP